MLLECTGKNSQDSHFDEAIRKAYDKKIKPVVQYSFTYNPQNEMLLFAPFEIPKKGNH